MALIDRYAAIDALTDTELRRNLDSVYDDDMKRIRRAAQRVIAQVPTVEAIPVEWLNQKYAENEPGEDKDYDYFLWDAIAYILTEWQKEQEAR